MFRLLLISTFAVGLFAQGGPAGHITTVKTLPTKCSPKSGDIVYLINSLGTSGALYQCTAANTYTVVSGGGGGSTPPTLVSFNTATSTCTIVSGTASGCTASSTSGTGSKPGIVVTDSFGQVVKWGSCFSGGTPSGIFGGLTYGNAIQDVTITSSNNVTTFTFSVDSSGYCGISTGGMGPQGATGSGVPTGGTTGQTLIKNSNTNYDTTWANAPTGPAQVSSNVGASLHADGAGGTVWNNEQWFGNALGSNRITRTWISERVNNGTNTFVPYGSDLSCQGASATCSWGYYTYNGNYMSAAPVTTGAATAFFAPPYGTFPAAFTGTEQGRLASKIRYYNAGGPTTNFNVWAIVSDTTANSILNGGGTSGPSSSSVFGFRYHTNTDFTDPAWMCVYSSNGQKTEVSSGVPIDTAWHTFEIALIESGPGSPDMQFYIDGTRVCQAGIASATYTVSTFFTNLGTYVTRYHGGGVYNYAAETGNEFDIRWMQLSFKDQ